MPAPPVSQTPPHLAEVHQGAADSPSKIAPQETQFEYKWEDPSGHTWAGTFTSRVPTIGQQIDIAKRVARRSHGTGEGSLPQDVSDLVYTIAYLETALVKRPSWANDLESLPYVEIVNGLAGEATAHLQAFRKRSGGPATGS